MKKGFIGLSLLLTFCLSACGASLFTPKTASSEESKNSITSVEESEESIETHSHSESTSKSESSETLIVSHILQNQVSLLIHLSQEVVKNLK